MQKECKLMDLGRIKSFEVEKNLIANYITDMDYFKDGEIIPFKALLANNIRDRQFDRFPKKTLKVFENTIIGKMRLLNHDSYERTGRFYDAKVIKKSKEEVIQMFQNVNFPGLEKHLEEVEETDNGLFFLETKFYMLNKTAKQQEHVVNVLGGIDAYMSISFTGFRWVPIYETENGNQVLKYGEYRISDSVPAEALEGSAVFLGAQYTAQITKEFLPISAKKNWVEIENIENETERDICQKIDGLIQKGMVADITKQIPEFIESSADWNTDFIKTLPDSAFIGKTKYPVYEKTGFVYLPNLRSALTDIGNNENVPDESKKQIKEILNKLGLQYNYKQKGNKMADIILALPSLGIAKLIDPEKGKEWQAEIDTAVQAKLAESKKAVEVAANVEKVFGANYSLETIEQAKKDAEAYRASLVTDAIFYGKTSKMIPETEEAAKKAFFEKLEITQLKEFIETYKSACKSIPASRQVSDKTDPNGSGMKDATSEDFQKSYVGGYQADIN